MSTTGIAETGGVIGNTEVTAARVLAIFDLDGTLIRGDTFLPFLMSYAWRQRLWRPLLTLPFWLALYACRVLSDRAAKQRESAMPFLPRAATV